MYKDVMEIDLRHVGWENSLWPKYFKKLRKQYRKIEEVDTGIIKFHYSNSKLTEFQIQVFVYGFLSEFLDKESPLRIEKSSSQYEKRLPLYQEPDSTAYLFYSTRLAIVQSRPELYEWLMQYFIYLKLFYNTDSMNTLFFDEELEQIMNLEYVSYQEAGADVIGYTREKIDHGIYVNIHLDDFYLSGKDGFDIRHYVHENLIYGYSDKERVFYAFGFGKKQKVQSFEITYEEFLWGYEKGKLFSFCGAKYLTGEYPWPVTLCSLKEIPKYSFEISCFVDKLKKHVYPLENEMVEGDLHIYGVNIYDAVLSELRGESDRGFVDFRVFQIFYEQKKCIRRRLEFLQEKYSMEAELEEFWTEYKKVEGSFQRIRLIYMKQLVMEGRADTLDKDVLCETVNLGIADKLEEVVEKEREVLESLLVILEKKLENK